MLRMEIVGASAAAMELWKGLRPVDTKLFENIWVKANPEEPVMDLSEVSIKQWSKHGDLYHGMKHTETGKAHGIVREINPNGNIHERTYKHGKIHGLNREVHDDIVKVFFYKDGEPLAQFNFDKDNKQTKVTDPDGILADIIPAFFKA